MRSGSQVEVQITILPAAAAKQRVLDHVLDLIGLEHREHDRIAVACDVGKRPGAAADLRKALIFAGIDVEADHGKSRRDQTARIDFAHQPTPITPTGLRLSCAIPTARS